MEAKKVDFSLSNLSLLELVQTYEEIDKFLVFLDGSIKENESSDKNE